MKKGEMLSNMIALAAQAHKGQLDKQGQPYILHPIKVMQFLKTEDEEWQCIAIGHDLLEDTNTKESDIYQITESFRVLNGIKALTKVNGEAYEQYKEKVLASKDAMLVKLADLTHNTDIRRLHGITEKDIKRLDRYCKFYTEIKERLAQWKKENVKYAVQLKMWVLLLIHINLILTVMIPKFGCVEIADTNR